MSERLLVTLATEADIEDLLRTRSWEPMFLTDEMRDIGRIEVVDAGLALATHGFDVKRWEPVREEERLYRPVPENIDCYCDPLKVHDNIAQDLSQRVFGCPHKNAMFLRNEPHAHLTDNWYEIENEEAYQLMMSDCAQNSRVVRDLGEFKIAMRGIHHFAAPDLCGATGWREGVPFTAPSKKFG